jgi:hypothetical protein
MGMRGRLILPGEDPDAFEAITGCAELEPWAVHMANHVARRLRYVLDGGYTARRVRDGVPTPGPDFLYSTHPRLFSGRLGAGPLRVAWDTNLLSDYFEYGARLWTGATAADLIPAGTDIQNQRRVKYALDWERLQHIVGLWTLRDIRFMIMPATLADAKPASGRLTPQEEADRRQQISRRFKVRRHAFWEFAAALSLVANQDGEAEEWSRETLTLPESLLLEALKSLPAGYDTILVDQAVRSHAQVFLTRDRKVIGAGEAFARFGLCITDPSGLWRMLLESGSFDCLLDGGSAQGVGKVASTAAGLRRCGVDHGVRAGTGCSTAG